MRFNTLSALTTGVFVITNYHTKTVLDLSGSDQVTISGWTSHGGTNQQWTFSQYGPYFAIQNVAYTNKYVGYNGQVQQTQQGQNVIGVTSPVLWALNQTDTNPPLFQFVVPDPATTSLVLDLSGGNSADGTLVELYANHDTDNQVWIIEQAN